jgi:hypothetical protein
MSDTEQSDDQMPPTDIEASAGQNFETQTHLSTNDYHRTTGEHLGETLNLDQWESGTQLTSALERLEREISEANQTETEIIKAIRSRVFNQLKNRREAPPCAGVFRASIGEIKRTQTAVLFNGLTEACDGTNVVYETLPIQIVQIAVALISYQGQESTWTQRIFRRDVRMKNKSDIADSLIDILNYRAQNDGNDGGLGITSMLRRAIMTTAERAVLTDKATAPWRIGHGNPLAYEILTGSGMPDIIEFGVPILERLVLEHERFLFVTSDTAKKHYLTIGNALNAGEYAIFDDASRDLEILLNGHYRGEWAKLKPMLRDFQKNVGPLVVSGVYRTSSLGPAHVFYAHRDHAHEAALIAMADSILQEFRNFPMLIDLADSLCKTYFGAETLMRPANASFASEDIAYQYLPERQTRNN